MTYPGIENDPAAPAFDPDRAAVEARRKERDEEYTKYVATQDIPWGAVPAYFAGEPVATTSVEKYGWEALGYVRRADANETPSDNAGTVRNAATASAPPVTTAATVKNAEKTGGNR